MRRPEGNADLLQVFSIIGHSSHHSREEHHIKATFLPDSSRVLSARRQAPRGPLVPRAQALRRCGGGGLSASGWKMAGRAIGGDGCSAPPRSDRD